MKEEKVTSKVITLASGEELEVCSPPLNAWDLAKRRYPIPKPPEVEEKVASGSTVIIQIVDDPDYLAEKEKITQLQKDLYDEVCALGSLRRVIVPDDFDAETEFGDIFRYADPDWKPREGRGGRKLDYIDHVFLTNTKDIMVVQEAMSELMGIDPEEVNSIQESFRDNLEGQTT